MKGKNLGTLVKKHFKRLAAGLVFTIMPTSTFFSPQTQADNPFAKEYVSVEEEPPVEMVKIPYEFSHNPFDKLVYKKRRQVKGEDVRPNMQATATMAAALEYAWSDYHAERSSLKGMDPIRDNLNIPIEVIGNKQDKERIAAIAKEILLEQTTQYGRMTFYSKEHGHPLFTPEDVKKYDLKWTDCTEFVTRNLMKATNENTIYNTYMDDINPLTQVAYTDSLTSFPPQFSEYMRSKGFESIYVAIDTKRRNWGTIYWNGMSRFAHPRPFFKKVTNGDYYAAIDYVVTDWDAYSDTFRSFIENTRGIVALHEFIHVAFLDKGIILDTKWSRNTFTGGTDTPGAESNIHTSSLIDRMTKTQEDRKEEIKSFVYWVPKNTVKAWNDAWQQQNTLYFAQTEVPKDEYLENPLYAKKED